MKFHASQSRFWRVSRLRFYTPWNQHNCQEAIPKGKHSRFRDLEILIADAQMLDPKVSTFWDPQLQTPPARVDAKFWPANRIISSLVSRLKIMLLKQTKLNWSGHIYQNLSFIYFTFCLLLFTYSAFIVHLVLICISSTIQWVFIFHSLIIHRLLIYLTSIIHLHLIFIWYSSIVHLQFIYC